MKQFATILLILCFYLSFAQHPNQVGYMFGVKIAPSWTGLVTYYETFFDGEKFSETNILDHDQFILKIAGKEYSEANPNGIDLFKKYQIPDSTIIDSLWKLRFAVYPYQTNSPDTLGWTQNFANPYVPTHKQKQILASLGMDTTLYTIFGNDLFHLLKLMCNPQWKNMYKNAK